MSKIKLLMFLLMSLAFTACFTTRPLVSPMRLALNERYSLQEIDGSLREAAANRGWILKDTGDQSYLAELQLRGHVAVVKITFDRSVMEARYVKSSELDYDGVNIHKKYHIWIDRLFSSVRKDLDGKRK